MHDEWPPMAIDEVYSGDKDDIPGSNEEPTLEHTSGDHGMSQEEDFLSDTPSPEPHVDSIALMSKGWLLVYV